MIRAGNTTSYDRSLWNSWESEREKWRRGIYSIKCKFFPSSNEVFDSETLNGRKRYPRITQKLVPFFNWEEISTSQRVSEKTWWHFSRGMLMIRLIFWFLVTHWFEFNWFCVSRFMHLLVVCHLLCLLLMHHNWRKSLLLMRRYFFRQCLDKWLIEVFVEYISAYLEAVSITKYKL